MKDTTAIVCLETHNFECIINGIQNLADSLIQPVFFYNEQHYHDEPDEREDWFALYYSIAAAANELIAASAEVVNTALANGHIEIVPGDTSWTTNWATARNKTKDAQ